MKIVKLANQKFKAIGGYYMPTGSYTLHEDGKGYVTFDGVTPYTPQGGKKALQSILSAGGFTEEPKFVKAI